MMNVRDFTLDCLQKFLARLRPMLVPTGAVFFYPAASVPTGFLKCDGSAVSRTTYSALFAVVGTTHGAGDGKTTFNLPDYRRQAAATFAAGRLWGDLIASPDGSASAGGIVAVIKT